MSDDLFKAVPDPPPVTPSVEARPRPEAIMHNGPPAPRPLTAPNPTSERMLRASTSEAKDGSREVVETIVFVIVLVLMLKTFIAEAFVIPTGSMATTLLGYHREVKCPQCGYVFAINNSTQDGEGQRDNQQDITYCKCPNCILRIKLDPSAPDGRGPP